MNVNNKYFYAFFLFCLCILISLFFIQNMTVVLFLVILNIILLGFKFYKFDLIIAFNVLNLFCFIFYYYWLNFDLSSGYFLGANSDDFLFDEVWSEDFIKLYGLDFSKIYDVPSITILHNSVGYVYLVSIFKVIASYVDGYHTIIARVFNCFCLVLMGYVISLISIEKFYKFHVKYFYLVCFTPVFIFNSVHVFRDTIIGFLIVLFYYVCIKNINFFLKLIYLLIITVVLFYFRNYLALLLLLFIPVFLVKEESFKRYLVPVVILFSIFFLYFVLSNDRLLESVNNYDNYNSERSDGFAKAIFDQNKIIGVFPRTAYMVITPIPSFSYFYQFFMSLSVLFQFFMLPFLLEAVLKIFDKRLVLFSVIIFFSVVLSTVTFRHVFMYSPLFYMILFSYFFDDRINRKVFLFNQRYFNVLVLICCYLLISFLIVFI